MPSHPPLLSLTTSNFFATLPCCLSQLSTFLYTHTHTHTHPHAHTHAHTHTHTAAVVLPEVLPTCEYHPSYVSVHEVTHYTGFKEVLTTISYPDDHALCKHGHHESVGNPMIEEEVCTVWDRLRFVPVCLSDVTL